MATAATLQPTTALIQWTFMPFAASARSYSPSFRDDAGNTWRLQYEHESHALLLEAVLRDTELLAHAAHSSTARNVMPGAAQLPSWVRPTEVDAVILSTGPRSLRQRAPPTPPPPSAEQLPLMSCAPARPGDDRHRAKNVVTFKHTFRATSRSLMLDGLISDDVIEAAQAATAEAAGNKSQSQQLTRQVRKAGIPYVATGGYVTIRVSVRTTPVQPSKWLYAHLPAPLRAALPRPHPGVPPLVLLDTPPPLQNMGATCALNTALQLLFNAGPLRHAILNAKLHSNDDTKRARVAMKHLAEEIALALKGGNEPNLLSTAQLCSTSDSVDPVLMSIDRNIVAEAQNASGPVNIGSEPRAAIQRFFLSMLTAQESSSVPSPPTATPLEIAHALGLVGRGGLSEERDLDEVVSAVLACFADDPNVCNNVCFDVTETTEDYVPGAAAPLVRTQTFTQNILRVPTFGHSTLSEAVKAAHADETWQLPGGAHRTVRRRVTRMPPVLFVSLQRSVQGMAGSRKNCGALEYPKYLDPRILTGFETANKYDSAEGGNSDDDETDANLSMTAYSFSQLFHRGLQDNRKHHHAKRSRHGYTLVSVAVHQGSAYTGHYTANVALRDGQTDSEVLGRLAARVEAQEKSTKNNTIADAQTLFETIHGVHERDLEEGGDVLFDLASRTASSEGSSLFTPPIMKWFSVSDSKVEVISAKKAVILPYGVTDESDGSRRTSSEGTDGGIASMVAASQCVTSTTTPTAVMLVYVSNALLSQQLSTSILDRSREIADVPPSTRISAISDELASRKTTYDFLFTQTRCPLRVATSDTLENVVRGTGVMPDAPLDAEVRPTMVNSTASSSKQSEEGEDSTDEPRRSVELSLSAALEAALSPNKRTPRHPATSIFSPNASDEEADPSDDEEASPMQLDTQDRPSHLTELGHHNFFMFKTVNVQCGCEILAAPLRHLLIDHTSRQRQRAMAALTNIGVPWPASLDHQPSPYAPATDPDSYGMVFRRFALRKNHTVRPAAPLLPEDAAYPLSLVPPWQGHQRRTLVMATLLPVNPRARGPSIIVKGYYPALHADEAVASLRCICGSFTIPSETKFVEILPILWAMYIAHAPRGAFTRETAAQLAAQMQATPCGDMDIYEEVSRFRLSPIQTSISVRRHNLRDGDVIVIQPSMPASERRLELQASVAYDMAARSISANPATIVQRKMAPIAAGVVGAKTAINALLGTTQDVAAPSTDQFCAEKVESDPVAALNAVSALLFQDMALPKTIPGLYTRLASQVTVTFVPLTNRIASIAAIVARFSPHISELAHHRFNSAQLTMQSSSDVIPASSRCVYGLSVPQLAAVSASSESPAATVTAPAYLAPTVSAIVRDALAVDVSTERGSTGDMLVPIKLSLPRHMAVERVAAIVARAAHCTTGDALIYNAISPDVYEEAAAEERLSYTDVVPVTCSLLQLISTQLARVANSGAPVQSPLRPHPHRSLLFGDIVERMQPPCNACSSDSRVHGQATLTVSSIPVPKAVLSVGDICADGEAAATVARSAFFTPDSGVNVDSSNVFLVPSKVVMYYRLPVPAPCPTCYGSSDLNLLTHLVYYGVGEPAPVAPIALAVNSEAGGRTVGAVMTALRQTYSIPEDNMIVLSRAIHFGKHYSTMFFEGDDSTDNVRIDTITDPETTADIHGPFSGAIPASFWKFDLLPTSPGPAVVVHFITRSESGLQMTPGGIAPTVVIISNLMTVGAVMDVVHARALAAAERRRSTVASPGPELASVFCGAPALDTTRYALALLAEHENGIDLVKWCDLEATIESYFPVLHQDSLIFGIVETL